MRTRLIRSANALKSPRTLAVVGLLIALNVVIGMLQIQVTQDLRFSFGYVAIAGIAMLYGPAAAIPAAAIGDILTHFVNPTGAYFFGFTVTAMVGAVFYSLFLYGYRPPRHDRPVSRAHRNTRAFFKREDLALLLRTGLAKFCVNLVCNVGLNTFWLTVMYGQSAAVILPARIAKNAIMLIPEIVVLFFAMKAVRYAADAVGLDAE